MINQIRNSSNLKETLVSLLAAEESTPIFEAGDLVRRECVGDEIRMRGIIEFSNYCTRSCLYCGLRCENGNIRRYRMSLDEIVAVAHEIKTAGLTTVVLQAGEDPHYTTEMLCELVRRIKAETGLMITLSLGEFELSVYDRLKEAGADRYLLRHETANPTIYAEMHPDGDLDTRINILRHLKVLGYEVGSGCLVGLPGQTEEDLADDLLLLKELDVDMIGLGPFVAHPDTPLKDHPTGSVETSIRMMSLARILTHDTNIPATTAMGIIEEGARIRALKAGCNVVMPVFTPLNYSQDYLIYPGKGARRAQLEDELKGYDKLFNEIGRRRGVGPGNRGGAI